MRAHSPLRVDICSHFSKRQTCPNGSHESCGYAHDNVAGWFFRGPYGKKLSKCPPLQLRVICGLKTPGRGDTHAWKTILTLHSVPWGLSFLYNAVLLLYDSLTGLSGIPCRNPPVFTYFKWLSFIHTSCDLEPRFLFCIPTRGSGIIRWEMSFSSLYPLSPLISMCFCGLGNGFWSLCARGWKLPKSFIRCTAW